MNTELKQEALNCTLSTKAQANCFNGARYEHDIGVLDVQFDAEWELIHGYHPIKAADWEKGFNLREGA